jgi:hypothetical protein
LLLLNPCGVDDTQVRGSSPSCSSIREGEFLRRLGALQNIVVHLCRICHSYIVDAMSVVDVPVFVFVCVRAGARVVLVLVLVLMFWLKG